LAAEMERDQERYQCIEVKQRWPEFGAGAARCPASGRTRTDAAERQVNNCELHTHTGLNSMPTGSAHQTVINCLGKAKARSSANLETMLE
jgi:hypothetical protein